MFDIIKIGGVVKYTLRGPDGKIKETKKVKNLITNAGFDAICDVIGNTVQPNDFAWTAVGTGTTAANVADTALETELGTRSTNTYAHSVGTKVFTATITYGAGVNTGAITESGLLNASTGGTLLNRQVFAAINKGAADSLEIEWSINLS